MSSELDIIANDNQHIDSNQSNSLLVDVVTIIEQARSHAYSAVNVDLVKRNWLLGKRIAEEELLGEERAEYGRKTIKNLSKQLNERFGKGFNDRDLYYCVKVFAFFPELFVFEDIKKTNNILQTVSAKSVINNVKAKFVGNIMEAMSPKFPSTLLSWSHYCKLLQVDDTQMREWYVNECANEFWSVRTLQRNISSQYCNRLLASQGKEKTLVREEMKKIVAPLQNDPKEFIKNPYVVEFLGLSDNPGFRETTFESVIISNLQKFLMEMGKGWAFMSRQQHIHTEKDDYYIDLVFYNVILKCYILIDLKTNKISYQDVGQMNMYIKMYDEKKRTEGDRPTLGIILCADTDEDIARYAINGNDQLFASKYLTVLPTKEELRREIERQKQLFLDQTDKDNE
ncbi:MAG: PDDEXK nuclease domain-containing protein [Bacteroidales bacterium]|nr:PDDEXK nuclease domain-containing protein [Bacteroidales bacterium]